ncbi:ATPase inhibitor subunit zeta [Ponticaulis sp.]|uniref:ATPase inhibitor subunit zeta n=1 Tax=Ponticaulis sp. TaxID=2020902 RepID=UPI000B722B3E|nr:ATPase inhibitor subunit zeta [Ponticaulis sp.]MAI89731.1 hypothetical protein [Ponticaulis sp.]OUY00747.1 MAG: hypothetical protein CBB65_04770 [Hyphomonadaceae bacterium TMED5]|tara:strand:+ start:50740 stop:51054 length:315 start_codon:yes stop_codon:yes gene_type:complete
MNNNIQQTLTSEDLFAREHRIDTFACRQLAEWALAHFGDRTEPYAYKRIVISLANSGADLAVDKIHTDLVSLGYNYRSEAVMRMYERFRRDAEHVVDTPSDLAA